MILPKVKQTTLIEWKKMFGSDPNTNNPRVVRCKKFQRRKCWDKQDNSRWRNSIITGRCINPLVYVDIESCLEYCIKHGLKDDVEYFKQYKLQNYHEISLEGGNRHDETEKMVNDPNEIDYLNKRVNYCVIRGVDRKEMHETYVAVAYGKAPNRQEQRTGIYGIVSDVVREKSEVLKNMWPKISKINLSRMNDDETTAMIMHYTTNFTFGATPSCKRDDSIDIIYRTSKYNKELFEYVISQLACIFGEYSKYKKSTRKLKKTVVWHMTVLLHHLYNKYKILSVADFVEAYHEKMEACFIDETVVYKNKHENFMFSNLMKGLVTDKKQLDKMKELIQNDWIPMLEEKNIISLSNKDNFPNSVKELWKRNNKFLKNGEVYFKVRTNSNDLTLLGFDVPEFTEIKLIDCWNCEFDHIIPRDLGGESVIENCELTSFKYNKAKSNKLINVN